MPPNLSSRWLMRRRISADFLGTFRMPCEAAPAAGSPMRSSSADAFFTRLEVVVVEILYQLGNTLGVRRLHRLESFAQQRQGLLRGGRQVQIALWILKPSSPTRSVHSPSRLGCGNSTVANLPFSTRPVRSHSSTVLVAAARGEDAPVRRERCCRSRFDDRGSGRAPCRFSRPTVAPPP